MCEEKVLKETTKWVNRFAPLYASAKRDRKLCDIPEKTIVMATGLIDGAYEQVVYVTAYRIFTGWIHMDDVEPYVRNLPYNVVTIEDQTPSKTDFEQFVIFHSVKQTNMCGQLCLAAVLEVSLGSILTRWEEVDLNWFTRMFGVEGRGRKATGTWYTDLIKIAEMFGRKAVSLSAALYQPHIRRSRYTIKGLNALLGKGSIIAAVKISPSTGLVQPSGIQHWIRLLTIVPERNGQGQVTFYNPAMNSVEMCSWSEFLASAKAVSGVFITNVIEDGV